jgi:hypothetical protein
MPSPHAFLVNGKVFFDPWPQQAEIMRRLASRVVTGGGAA